MSRQLTEEAATSERLRFETVALDASNENEPACVETTSTKQSTVRERDTDSAGSVQSEVVCFTCGEWSYDPPAEPKDGNRKGFVSHTCACIVHCSMNRKKLAPNWCESRIRNPAKVAGEVFGGAVAGSVEEEGFELLVRLRVDSDTGMPLRLSAVRRRGATPAVADRVALEFDGIPAAVADSVALFLLEPVMALRGKKQKPIAVSDVLHVGEAALLAMGTLPGAQLDPVFVDQLTVDCFRGFAPRNPASNVPPVAVTQVADGYLLDQSFRR